MRAIWLEDLTLSIRDNIAIPECKDGEVLVRVRLAGICSTDLEMVRGYYPFSGILGHEFVGEVVEAQKSWPEGTRVTGEINVSCGVCSTCRRGNISHCENRKTLGIHNYPGCFAEYVTLPHGNLHRIPDQISDEVAVFTEPLAAAIQILEQVHIHSSDRVLVVGAGRLGQLIAQIFALTSCNLFVVVRHAIQEEILAKRKINTIHEDEIAPQEYDIVVDATGSPGGFSQSLEAVRPRGTLVVKSTYAENLNINLSTLVVNEVKVIGSRCGPFEPAIRLLNSGKVDPTSLITASYPLDDGLAALKHAAHEGVLKILLEF